jgi:hypothetical protein
MTIIANITLGLTSRGESGSTMTTIDNYIQTCDEGSTAVYLYKENTTDPENELFDLTATLRILVSDRVAAVSSLEAFVSSPLFSSSVKAFRFTYEE